MHVAHLTAVLHARCAGIWSERSNISLASRTIFLALLLLTTARAKVDRSRGVALNISCHFWPAFRGSQVAVQTYMKPRKLALRRAEKEV
jgi:hypothetical protein